MKSKDFHSKKLSLHYLKTSDFRWESPQRTPTTLTSFSFSSQELCGSQTSTHRHRTSSMSEFEECKAKDLKNFHEEYLEFGLWPDMPTMTQSAMKAKYRSQRVKVGAANCEAERLRGELRSVKDNWCVECHAERERHKETKKALDEAMALSAALMHKVVEMDAKNGKDKRPPRRAGSPASPTDAL